MTRLSVADSGTTVSDEQDVDRADRAGSRHEEYLRLRHLATENAREARIAFTILLDSKAPALEHVLRQAAAPGEGRLRHVIANALRVHPVKGQVVEHLLQWLETETDAFARRAIDEALSGVPRNTLRGRVPAQEPTPFAEHIPRAYRYVAGQLRHEVRNALVEVQTPLRELGQIAETLPPSDPLRARLEEQIRRARTGLKNAGLSVEFHVGDGDSHFRLRPVTVYDWLQRWKVNYAAAAPAEMRVEAMPSDRSLTVRASDYFLETVFKNVWNNARQATNTPCLITAKVTVAAGNLCLLLLDNGPGFSAEAAEQAFRDPFSSKGAGRGRGLLEIDEAMAQMNGSVELTAVGVGEFRLRLTFPVEGK